MACLPDKEAWRAMLFWNRTLLLRGLTFFPSESSLEPVRSIEKKERHKVGTPRDALEQRFPGNGLLCSGNKKQRGLYILLICRGLPEDYPIFLK